jgi:Gamma-glutamyl cyclotransferase, AIG2-like
MRLSPRRIDVFFYGLFMDQQLLEGKGIKPVDVRVASVSGFRLRIGSRAALVPEVGANVHGILMRLTHAELDRLYSEPSVQAYRPEPVLAVDRNGSTVAALCYNLPELPSPDEHNSEYAVKLRALAQRIGLPSEYVNSIG